MGKGRITVTFTREYEPNKDYYPHLINPTTEDMFESDLRCLKEDPMWLLEDISSVDITYEIIEE